MDAEDFFKKKKEEEAQVKPKFLTREEREKLALERRAQAVADRAAKIEEQHRTRDQFLQDAADSKKKDTGGRDNRRDYRDREREKEKERLEKEKEKEREKEREKVIYYV
jgi:ATP-dependent RNA helicase DDX23/PRP28